MTYNLHELVHWIALWHKEDCELGWIFSAAELERLDTKEIEAAAKGARAMAWALLSDAVITECGPGPKPSWQKL